MRIYSIVIVIAVAAICAISSNACSPYSPSLPPAPFLCGSGMPMCPDGYTCMAGAGSSVCIGSNGDVPVDGNGSACADPLEPDDTIQTAYQTPVDTQKKTIPYSGLSICPAGDKDTYAVTISSSANNESLDVQVTYDAGGATLQVAILNSGGAQIATSSPVSGMTDTVHANVQNLPQGEYYGQVSAVAGGAMTTNNYKMTITTSP